MKIFGKSRPFGMARSVRDPAALSSGVFNVVNYGADPTGVMDSTFAIQNALDRAGQWAKEHAQRATVSLPAGEFKVMPYGRVSVDVYEKEAGNWALVGSDATIASTFGTVRFTNWMPAAGLGQDGDFCIAIYTGAVYIKTAGNWVLNGSLSDAAGTGWSSGHYVPHDGNGENGDYYFRYLLAQVNGSCFQINDSHDNVTITGEGKSQTILQYRCWGDVGADAYAVNEFPARWANVYHYVKLAGVWQRYHFGNLAIEHFRHVDDGAGGSVWESAASVEAAQVVDSTHYITGEPGGVGLDGDFCVSLDSGIAYQRSAGSWVVVSEYIPSFTSGTGWSSGTGNPPAGASIGDVYWKYTRTVEIVRTVTSATTVDSVYRPDTGTYYYSAYAPLAQGVDGDFHVGHLSGEVWKKVTGAWVKQADFSDGSGAGWYVNRSAPVNSNGQNGEVYVRPIYAIADSTKVPMRNDQSYAGSYRRGHLFQYPTASMTITGVSIENLWMKGNTIANGFHGYNMGYHDLHEWDVGHKAVIYGGGVTVFVGCSIKNCDLEGWRGEVVYKGGESLAELLIEDCDIHDSNGSAISFGGKLTVRRTRVFDAYNGVENFCTTGQFTIIDTCELMGDSTATRGFRAQNGAVYIGPPDGGNAYLLISNTLLDGHTYAVFLSEFAQNVEIDTCVFRDCSHGVYTYNMAMAPYNQFWSMAYHGLHIHDCQFYAKTRNITNAIWQAFNNWAGKFSGWVIEDNSVLADAGFSVGTLFSHHNDERFASLSRNNAGGGRLITSNGDDIPTYSANTNVERFMTWWYDDVTATFDNPRIAANMPGGRANGNLICDGPMIRYWEGQQVQIQNVSDPERASAPGVCTVTLPADAAWNAWSTDIVLDYGEMVNLVFNSAGKWEVAP